MKRINLLFIALIGIIMGACSSSKPLTDEEIYRHKQASLMLEQQTFMVRADQLQLGKRYFPSINGATNFIVVDGNQAVVQISPSSGPGVNGVGGYTIKGLVSGYEMKVKGNGDINVSYNVTASNGSCSVYISLPRNGCNAIVNIQSTYRSGRATIYGEIAEIDNTIFVGRTL